MRTGVRIESTAQAPDAGITTDCGVRATVSNVRQFNGEWLRIRVDHPRRLHAATSAVNDPENHGRTRAGGGSGTCSRGNASDTTTWQARIEGNPVHLTS